MAELLEKLFVTARSEIEGVSIQPTQHDVRRSVRKALIPFLPNASSRLEVHIPTTEVMAEIDPFVIDQTISNLVDNALRFTAGRVFVAVRETPDGVALTVSDEGPGFREEQLRRVLNPLLWEDTDIENNAGLGLHIVETLVSGQGGEIDVISDPVGTRMCVTIPTAFDRAHGREVVLERG
jgi:signal transduction histidine kinase